jgi:hypothetical protein
MYVACMNGFLEDGLKLYKIAIQAGLPYRTPFASKTWHYPFSPAFLASHSLGTFGDL